MRDASVAIEMKPANHGAGNEGHRRRKQGVTKATVNTEAAADAARIEHEFLTGVQAKLEDAKGRHLRGSSWRTTSADDEDALRAQMASRRMYDRELLKRLPRNRRVTLTGYDRHLLFWKKATGAVTATVLTPTEALLDGGDPPPVGLNELSEHLRRVAPDSRLRQVVGVCAPTGFTAEARDARLDQANLSVVLVEPDGQGGWRVAAGEGVPDFVRKLFDPEDAEQKRARVRAEVMRRGADLITGGLSADHLADSLQLPPALVRSAVADLAKSDPELRVSLSGEDLLLYRGAPVFSKEKRSMSFVERIRELFDRDGDEADKINVLSERRAALAQRRDRLYEEIGKLEEREAGLLQQGRENTSTVVRRRLAAQVAQIRKDIARQNTSAKMLNQQINIIATDIHNLTLIQQGESASLPTTDELTENAVKAEEMLETLRADADMVASLETGVGEVLTSDEESDILAEFDAPAAAADAAPASSASAPERARSAADDDPIIAEFDQPADPPARDRKQAADPEAN
jgi:hypothetical protein